jgi:formyl-CoA transferase
MMDTMLFGSSGLPTLAATGAPPPRQGNETNFVAPSNVFACRDGHLYLAVALDKHWAALCTLIGRAELARADGYRTNVERLANRDAVNALVAGWCAGHTVAECAAACSAAGLVAAAVRTLSEVVRDPNVAARRMLQDTVLSDGSVAPLVGPPVKFSRTPTRIRRAAPQPGADTDTVLDELAPPPEGD